MVAAGSALLAAGIAGSWTGVGALLIPLGMALNAVGNSINVNPTSGERSVKMDDRAAISTAVATVGAFAGGALSGLGEFYGASASTIGALSAAGSGTANVIGAGFQYDNRGRSSGWSLDGRNRDGAVLDLATSVAAGAVTAGYVQGTEAGSGSSLRSALVSEGISTPFNVAGEYYKYRAWGTEYSNYTGMMNAGLFERVGAVGGAYVGNETRALAARTIGRQTANPDSDWEAAQARAELERARELMKRGMRHEAAMVFAGLGVAEGRREDLLDELEEQYSADLSAGEADYLARAIIPQLVDLRDGVHGAKVFKSLQARLREMGPGPYSRAQVEDAVRELTGDSSTSIDWGQASGNARYLRGYDSEIQARSVASQGASLEASLDTYPTTTPRAGGGGLPVATALPGLFLFEYLNRVLRSTVAAEGGEKRGAEDVRQRGLAASGIQGRLEHLAEASSRFKAEGVNAGLAVLSWRKAIGGMYSRFSSAESNYRSDLQDYRREGSSPWAGGERFSTYRRGPMPNEGTYLQRAGFDESQRALIAEGRADLAAWGGFLDGALEQWSGFGDSISVLRNYLEYGWWDREGLENANGAVAESAMQRRAESLLPVIEYLRDKPLEYQVGFLSELESNNRYGQAGAFLATELAAYFATEGLASGLSRVRSTAAFRNIDWSRAMLDESVLTRGLRRAEVGSVSASPGPIGRFATAHDFAAEAFSRYQRYVDEGYEVALRAEARGRLRIPEGVPRNTVLGQRTDSYARFQMHEWLKAEGIAEGPGRAIQLNRRLRNPAGEGYRIPDVRLPNGNLIMDATLGYKTAATRQVMDFARFSGGNRVTIVRPTQLGGSYSVLLW